MTGLPLFLGQLWTHGKIKLRTAAGREPDDRRMTSIFYFATGLRHELESATLSGKSLMNTTLPSCKTLSPHRPGACHFWSTNSDHTELNSRTASPLHPIMSSLHAPKRNLRPTPSSHLPLCMQFCRAKHTEKQCVNWIFVKQGPFSYRQSYEMSEHNLALNFCLHNTVFTITSREILTPKGP